ncbi:hypothetical protein C8F01DRAFT_1363474 [Mycena amicta]|nr:hypothetical protein C8F01DRAFT_1363474 [Mycena amicta]
MNCSDALGPQMNTDISGVGVRVSFYLQALFLGCLFARSVSVDEFQGALYTLLSTNTAMVITAFILGFKRHPDITFHDALIVLYLLCLSGLTVFAVSLSSKRFKVAKLALRYFAIIQTYLILAFALALLIKAESFGSRPQCNQYAVVVLLRPFSALKPGRIVCFVLVAVFTMFYTVITVEDHLRAASRKIRMRRRTRRVPGADKEHSEANEAQQPLPDFAPQSVAHNSPNTQLDVDDPYSIDWDVILTLAVVLVLWATAVMNTELLIRWNHFAPTDHTWQFGQVLPMVLLFQPLVDVSTSFWELGLRPHGNDPVYNMFKGEPRHRGLRQVPDLCLTCYDYELKAPEGPLAERPKRKEAVGQRESHGYKAAQTLCHTVHLNHIRSMESVACNTQFIQFHSVVIFERKIAENAENADCDHHTLLAITPINK